MPHRSAIHSIHRRARSVFVYHRNDPMYEDDPGLEQRLCRFEAQLDRFSLALRQWQHTQEQVPPENSPGLDQRIRALEETVSRETQALRQIHEEPLKQLVAHAESLGQLSRNLQALDRFANRRRWRRCKSRIGGKLAARTRRSSSRRVEADRQRRRDAAGERRTGPKRYSHIICSACASARSGSPRTGAARERQRLVLAVRQGWTGRYGRSRSDRPGSFLDRRTLESGVGTSRRRRAAGGLDNRKSEPGSGCRARGCGPADRRSAPIGATRRNRRRHPDRPGFDPVQPHQRRNQRLFGAASVESHARPRAEWLAPPCRSTGEHLSTLAGHGYAVGRGWSVRAR